MLPRWSGAGKGLRKVKVSQLVDVSVADFRADLDPTGELAAKVVALLAHVLP